MSAGSVARANEVALDRSIAVWRIDALGIDDEIVARLEALFRIELERLAGKPLPSRREVERAIGKRRRLLACTGEPGCLADIGKRVGVELIVSGNVAQLGDTYVVNLKLVEVATETELRRVASDPLRGNADDLIEGVRVAAYRLVAPDRLQGSIAVLTDLVGAEVAIDGVVVGATPLPAPIGGLALGDHKVRVTATNYTPFEETVQVRFQKTTRVVVRLVLAQVSPIARPGSPGAAGPRDDAPRWYRSTWFYVGVGVAAVALGGYVGWQLGKDDVVDCGASPMACQ